jgi:hypothetical protein
MLSASNAFPQQLRETGKKAKKASKYRRSQQVFVDQKDAGATQNNQGKANQANPYLGTVYNQPD